MAEQGGLERSHSHHVSETGSLYLSAGEGGSFTSTEYYDLAADNAESLVSDVLGHETEETVTGVSGALPKEFQGMLCNGTSAGDKSGGRGAPKNGSDVPKLSGEPESKAQVEKDAGLADQREGPRAAGVDSPHELGNRELAPSLANTIAAAHSLEVEDGGHTWSDLKNQPQGLINMNGVDKDTRDSVILASPERDSAVEGGAIVLKPEKHPQEQVEHSGPHPPDDATPGGAVASPIQTTDLPILLSKTGNSAVQATEGTEQSPKPSPMSEGNEKKPGPVKSLGSKLKKVLTGKYREQVTTKEEVKTKELVSKSPEQAGKTTDSGTDNALVEQKSTEPAARIEDEKVPSEPKMDRESHQAVPEQYPPQQSVSVDPVVAVATEADKKSVEWRESFYQPTTEEPGTAYADVVQGAYVQVPESLVASPNVVESGKPTEKYPAINESTEVEDLVKMIKQAPSEPPITETPHDGGLQVGDGSTLTVTTEALAAMSLEHVQSPAECSEVGHLDGTTQAVQIRSTTAEISGNCGAAAPIDPEVSDAVPTGKDCVARLAEGYVKTSDEHTKEEAVCALQDTNMGSQGPISDVPVSVSTPGPVYKETVSSVPREDLLGRAVNVEGPEQEAKPGDLDATDIAVDNANLEVDARVPVASEFTRVDAEDLNKELAGLLADLGLDSNKYFERPLDDFPTLADFYEELGANLSKDGCDLDVSETLATRLGDDAAIVVELRRREYLEDVRKLDSFIKESLGEAMSTKIFVSEPQEFPNPLKYYTSCQLLAKEHGIDLLPLIKKKMGEEHPLVIALGGEEPIQALGWHTMKKREPSELPVSEGGVVIPTDKEGAENKPDAANIVQREMPKAPQAVIRDETAEPRASWCCFCGRAR